MQTVDEALDGAWASLQRGAVDEALEPLARSLARFREAATPEQWVGLLARIRHHELCKAIHRDPFTFRCFSRPRGYPGDGVALDYILKRREAPAGTRRDPTALIHGYMTATPFSRAVRFRRDQVARQIDERAATAGRPARIFAGWAGHLRELEASAAAREGRLGAVVAFDHDGQNLEVARSEHPGVAVEPVTGSLRELVDGRHAFGDFDLVYCGGELERLPHASPQGLVRSLFGMIARGGRLVVPSLLPTLPDAAMLEAFFDWRLSLRGEREIFGLAAAIPREDMGSWLYSANDESTLGVLVIDRRR